jgi:hypothetical protein
VEIQPLTTKLEKGEKYANLTYRALGAVFVGGLGLFPLEPVGFQVRADRRIELKFAFR